MYASVGQIGFAHTIDDIFDESISAHLHQQNQYSRADHLPITDPDEAEVAEEAAAQFWKTPRNPKKEDLPPSDADQTSAVPAGDVNECSICIETKQADRMLTCPECNAEVCRRCTYKNFKRKAGKGILPTCVSCGKSFTFKFIRDAPGFKKAKGAIGYVARRRIGALALNREKALLVGTERIAAIYRRRRIALSAISVLRAKLESWKHKYIIAGHVGEDQVPLRRIKCGEGLFEAIQGVVSDLTPRLEITEGRMLRHVLTLREAFETEMARLADLIIIRGSSQSGKEDLENLLALAFVARHARMVYINEYAMPHGSETILKFEFKCRTVLREAGATVETELPAEAARIIESHIESVEMLASFLTQVPREWWLVRDPKDIVGLLAISWREEFYGKKMVRREMITRPPRSALESASGSVIERACVRTPACRGHMYRRPAAPSGTDSADAVVVQPTIQDVRAARAARFAAAGNQIAVSGPDFILACQLCGTTACTECHEPFSDSDRHVCDPDTAKSISEIKATTRPCPQCGERISRTEGCRHMFCPRCKQAYDWETLETHVYNTNPGFLSWMQEQRRQTAVNSNHGSYEQTVGEDIRATFTAPGDDGLTTRTRLSHIRAEFREGGYSVLAEIVSSLVNLEVSVIQKCVTNIPTPMVFEYLRTSFLLGDITEETWTCAVTALEIKSFVLQKLVGMVTEYLDEALKVVCDAFERGRGATNLKRQIEADAFASVLRLARDLSLTTSVLEIIPVHRTPLVWGILGQSVILANNLGIAEAGGGESGLAPSAKARVRDLLDGKDSNLFGTDQLDAIGRVRVALDVTCKIDVLLKNL